MPSPAVLGATQEEVPSLLDAIQDDIEYNSIVSKMLRANVDLVEETVKGIREIEKLRARPCLAYVGNVVKGGNAESAIDAIDDLPFTEMVENVPPGAREVDIFLAMNGGSAHQVSRFVNCLRARFDEVHFLIPSFCMSAGTIFALSGNSIWMTPRACLGPIDPQVPSRDGRLLPAQALLLLVARLQSQGDEALQKKQPLPWTAIRIIDTIDKKELGEAITATNYSTMLASEFLVNYKLKNWTKREGSGEPVTADYRKQRAMQIAGALASHDRWKSHGHAISRDILWAQVKLLIDHPDKELQRAIYRLWALFYWIFDKTPAYKFIVSANYRFIRGAMRMREARK